MAENFTSKVNKMTNDELIAELEKTIIWKAEHDASWIEHCLSESIKEGKFTTENGKNHVSDSHYFYDRYDFEDPKKAHIDYIYLLPILTAQEFERAMISNFKEVLNAVTLTDKYYRRNFWGNDCVGIKPQLVVDHQVSLPFFRKTLNALKEKGTHETYAKFDNTTQLYLTSLNVRLLEKGIKISNIHVSGDRYGGIKSDATISNINDVNNPFYIGLHSELSKGTHCTLDFITINTELEF